MRPHTVCLVRRMQASPPQTPGVFSTQLAAGGDGEKDTAASLPFLGFMLVFLPAAL
jgi:hypothetical protein